MDIILYSTNCPKCGVLEKKLQLKHIQYTVVDDVRIMQEKDILSVPVLEVEGKLLDFKAAIDWVNSVEE